MFTDWYFFHEILHHYVWTKFFYENILDPARQTPALKQVEALLLKDAEYLRLIQSTNPAEQTIGGLMRFHTLHHIHMHAIRLKVFGAGSESLRLIQGMERQIGSGYGKGWDILDALSPTAREALVQSLLSDLKDTVRN